MKYFCFLFISLISINLSAQDNPYGSRYDDVDFNAMKIIRVIESSSFQPINVTTDLKQFKSALLQMPERAFKQLNIDTWYLCSYSHDENYQIYNMYYKPVTRAYYDQNCKALIALMLLDRTIRQPK